MPNTYIKAEKRVALALALLHQRSRLAGLVTRFDGRNFIGARNDTLLYETEGVTIARDYEFRTRTAPIEWNEIARTTLPIKLDQHMVQGVKFTDEEELLDLRSYRDEILLPQVKAIATRFDKKINAALTSYTNWKTTNFAVNPTGDTDGKQALTWALKLKRKADQDRVPTDGRILVLGANAFMYFMSSEALQKYDTTQATTAFRQGVFGRVAGMDVFDGSDLVGDNEIYVIHPSWNVLANAAPNVPAGVAWGARQTYEGWSLRVIRDYDANYAQDRSLVNTFWGLSPIEDEPTVHTTASATAAGNGFEAGDPVVTDGQLVFTGKNVRGVKAVFTPVV